jgi:transglutaminase-like putative cysteine protease
VAVTRDLSGLVSCGPVPTWVRHDAYASQTPASDSACIGNGICRLLHDVQMGLGPSTSAWHYRRAQRVLTRAGAEQTAHFVADFDPTYQRLDVHYIRVRRGEQTFDHADLSALQIFRRETSLERLALDGRLTVSLVVPDVRVDDIVEISLTVHGANPVLHEKLSGWMSFDGSNPWRETRYRILRANSRPLKIKAFGETPDIVVTRQGEFEESRWWLVGQARRETEEFTPPWLIVGPVLQYSEFDDWPQIARYFTDAYVDDGIPAGMLAVLDALRADHVSAADRAVEWLRTVQREVRYFALSLGDGALIPRSVATIWNGRFGDCKDAAKLYVAGARYLGLDASAALVSTTFGPVLETVLPSSNLFNHCIVRVSIDGEHYWLDPTLSMQGGTLDKVYQPNRGWALCLTEGCAGLEPFGSDEPLHHLNVEEDFHFGPKTESPARLCRQLEFYSWAADAMRSRFANEGTVGYAKDALKSLEAEWQAVESAPMALRDELRENCLTVTLNYEIRNCWKAVPAGRRLAFNLVDNALAGELGPLAASQRAADIFLGRPRRLTKRSRLHMPTRWLGDGWRREEHTAGVNFSSALEVNGRTLLASRSLTTEAWSFPAGKAREYSKIVSELQQNQLAIWAKERFGRVGPVAGLFGVSFGTIQAAALGFFIGLMLLRILAQFLK